MFNLTRSYNCIRKLRYTCFRIFSENSFLTFYGNYETVAATEPARLIYFGIFFNSYQEIIKQAIFNLTDIR